MTNLLIWPVVIPAIAGIIALLFKKQRFVKEAIALIATSLALVASVIIFKQNLSFTFPWAGFGIDLAFRADHFTSFIIVASSAFGVLIALYSAAFMREKCCLNQFYAYFLLTVAFVNGAALSDNLVAVLFFWEGLLVLLFGLIYIGGKEAYKTSVKAFVISGLADLCMMFGIGMTIYLAYQKGIPMNISSIAAAGRLPLDALGSVAFTFLMIGAIAKAGSMPFHSWIPDAAIDAPLPFMALVPAALEKLVGIYFLARITLFLFQFTAASWVSMMLMIIGSITILLAVAMALVQKDYKRLLSYHAISQVGYMILGIGTAVPVGIVGGIFHMINHAMYKSCLFLTGGSVEKQAGTTDLKKLGGLVKAMPITFGCFFVAAAAISGVPPFNGFFSKELVYDGALERGWIFYAAAALGSFLTAASFLKLGHAAYFDKASDEQKGKDVKEAPVAMLIPMIIIAAMCILFGVYNQFPIHNLIQPILGEHLLEGHDYAGWPTNTMIVIITVVILLLAYINHRYGVKKSGSGLGASEHIHHAPGLAPIYDMAEKRYFDPYDIGLVFVGWFSRAVWYIDRGIDWIYNVLSVETAYTITGLIKKAHNGSYSMYILWSVAGFILMIAYFFMR